MTPDGNPPTTGSLKSPPISIGLDDFEQAQCFLAGRSVANLRWPPRPQSLDVFQFQTEGLLVKENNRVKGLILGAGRDTSFSKLGEELFKLLLASPVRGKPIDVVAITFEPGAVTLPGVQRKMLPSNDLF